jgi:hypothetical protein
MASIVDSRPGPTRAGGSLLVLVLVAFVGVRNGLSSLFSPFERRTTTRAGPGAPSSLGVVTAMGRGEVMALTADYGPRAGDRWRWGDDPADDAVGAFVTRLLRLEPSEFAQARASLSVKDPMTRPHSSREPRIGAIGPTNCRSLSLLGTYARCCGSTSATTMNRSRRTWTALSVSETAFSPRSARHGLFANAFAFERPVVPRSARPAFTRLALAV